MPTELAGILGLGDPDFYRWRDAFQKHGDAGLKERQVNSQEPGQPNAARRSSRKCCICGAGIAWGPIRIVWYLARYHDIKISDAGAYRILRAQRPQPSAQRHAHAESCTPSAIRGRCLDPSYSGRRYVPDLHRKNGGRRVRRLQYTAIDDATRVRALKVYEKHTQANAIRFIDHIIEIFPFRIREVRTDNGHEFQAKFHWHVEDLGIRHAYIKRGTPQLNGKVERSHRSDQQEFYQLLSSQR